jgi:tRNA A-37 threonylcarbamoyl transferase component Bud32
MFNTLMKVYTNTREYIYKRFLWKSDLAHWKKMENVVLEEGGKGYRIRTEKLGITWPGQAADQSLSLETGDRVIADIDHDGFWLSHVGPISGVVMVSEHDFRPRRRAFLKAVEIDGFVGIQKDFRGDYYSFVNELRSLYLLSKAGVHVPAVFKMDYEVPSLTFAYINGLPLSEEFARRGALLRNRQRETHPELIGLSRPEQSRKVMQSAKKVIHEVIDQQFVNKVFGEVEKMHAARIIWNDVKYGNILLESESKEPYLIDFAYARYYPRLWKKLFAVLIENENTKLHTYLDF